MERYWYGLMRNEQKVGLDLIVDTPYTVMTTRAPEVLKITLLVAKRNFVSLQTNNGSNSHAPQVSKRGDFYHMWDKIGQILCCMY